MPKCDFNKVASANFLHIFRTLFLKNTFGEPLLTDACESLKELTSDRITIKQCFGYVIIQVCFFKNTNKMRSK